LTAPPGEPVSGIAKKPIPRHDWILLPIVGLVTIAVLVAAAELLARFFFPASTADLQHCFVSKNSDEGVQGIPNGVCRDKRADEPQFVVYRLNQCGHRSELPCGSKPPATSRIVLVGSSIAFGPGVPREATYPAMLPADLSRLTGRTVDVYNEGTFGALPFHNMASHFDEIRAARPDMILWVIGIYDVEAKATQERNNPVAAEGPQSATKKTSFWDRLPGALAPQTLQTEIRSGLVKSRAGVVFRAFISQHESERAFVSSYLANGDREAGFLKAEPSEQWVHNESVFDQYAAAVAQQARAAHIPLFVVFAPNAAQAEMISLNAWSPEYDPYRLDRELQPVLARNGATFIDILPDFRGVQNPRQYYFPVDGHPNAGGHALLERMLLSEFSKRGLPALKAFSAVPSAAAPPAD
jgi:hypothetical protein